MTAAARLWSVTARHLPEHADNLIHPDDGARAIGFGGALVAGTTVHAYLVHPIVEAWGADWLAEGTSTIEFLAPVEAGDRIDCVPVPADDGSVEVRAEVAGTLRARLKDRGSWCTGKASLRPPPTETAAGGAGASGHTVPEISF